MRAFGWLCPLSFPLVFVIFFSSFTFNLFFLVCLKFTFSELGLFLLVSAFALLAVLLS
jgi:hypothetical protein